MTTTVKVTLTLQGADFDAISEHINWLVDRPALRLLAGQVYEVSSSGARRPKGHSFKYVPDGPEEAAGDFVREVEAAKCPAELIGKWVTDGIVWGIAMNESRLKMAGDWVPILIVRGEDNLEHAMFLQYAEVDTLHGPGGEG